jgi:hypothetical protein
VGAALLRSGAANGNGEDEADAKRRRLKKRLALFRAMTRGQSVFGGPVGNLVSVVGHKTRYG